MKFYLIKVILFVVVSTVFLSCKKNLEIPPPTNTIVTEQAFYNDQNATSAILGIYSKLIDKTNGFSFANGAVALIGSLSSDELINFSKSDDFDQFYLNKLLSTNAQMYQVLWTQHYSIIYMCNAALEGISESKNITASTAKRLRSEALFIRSFCYFYLINYFGDVPYISSTNWEENLTAKRVSSNEIYKFIVADLQEAKGSLPDNFSSFNNERIRVTKWAAAAMLSRIYLFTSQWDKAVSESSEIISNSSLFNLASDVNAVFLKNSGESILQLQIDGKVSPYNVTPDGNRYIPFNRTQSPQFFFQTSFLTSFLNNDDRRRKWIDSTIYLGTTYYYPFKYKVGPSQMVANSIPTEYFTMLRLSEQYLIRAESQGQLSNVAGGLADLNAIRVRAKLIPLSLSTPAEVITEVQKERQRELFCEWGFRWLDLKRTGKINEVMSTVTPIKGGGQWNPSKQLFPIPQRELILNSNLTQNLGY